MADLSPDLREWYALRRKNIHEKVECHEILRRNGFSFRHTSDREEQFSCPFHGKDDKPSARVYPSAPQSYSHVYCFVCKPAPSWDAIALWKKFSGEDKSHHTLLSELEKTFGIALPPIPDGAYAASKVQTFDEKKREVFERLRDACESRLIDARVQYRQLNDLTGYLAAGSVLDKASYQVSVGSMGYEEGTALMSKLLRKIGERIRSCLEP